MKSRLSFFRAEPSDPTSLPQVELLSREEHSSLLLLVYSDFSLPLALCYPSYEFEVRVFLCHDLDSVP